MENVKKQKLKAIAFKSPVHCDAVQNLTALDIQFNELVDALLHDSGRLALHTLNAIESRFPSLRNAIERIAYVKENAHG